MGLGSWFGGTGGCFVDLNALSVTVASRLGFYGVSRNLSTLLRRRCGGRRLRFEQGVFRVQ